MARTGAPKGPRLNGAHTRVKVIHFFDGIENAKASMACGGRLNETKLITAHWDQTTCPKCLEKKP